VTAFIFSDLNYKVVIFLSQTESTPKHFFVEKKHWLYLYAPSRLWVACYGVAFYSTLHMGKTYGTDFIFPKTNVFAVCNIHANFSASGRSGYGDKWQEVLTV
jgi:hypothetical protein